MPIYCRSYKDPLTAALDECRKRTQVDPVEGEPPIQYFRRVARDISATLVIICDQFEEFFVSHRSPEEREPFVSFIAKCYGDQTLPVKFLVSMGSDFLYLIHAEFGSKIAEPLISSRLYHLRNFEEAHAVAIIERSARRASLPFEAGLTRQIARDLASTGTVSPSELQIVGEQLQTKRIYTLPAYRLAGGKESLVHSFLEDVIQASGDADGARLLLRSVISEENTRLTLTLDEIARRTQSSAGTGFVTGDLNGDGRLDLVAIGHGNNTPCRLLVLMQNASGHYDGISQEPMGVNQGLCNGRDALALGDVDGDGDLDLIAQGTDNTSTPRLILFLNDGTGTLLQNQGQSFSNGDGRFIAVGFQGGIYASTNATNWSPQVGATPRLQNAVTASSSGTQFVSVGESVIEYANFTPNTTISISDVTLAEGNSGTVNAVFTVTLTNTDGSAPGAAVNFNTVNGTATTADNDYQANAGTLTFLPMETTKQITVLVNGDTMFEPNEAFTVHLSGSIGATISDADGAGTITNDDSAPTLAVDDVSHGEGNAGTTPYTFTVTKTGTTALSSSVNFTTVDSTATIANSDYQFQSGTLNFLATDTSKQVTVLVNGDTTVEPDEAFTIHLSGASGATIIDADGTGAIINDDCSISLSSNSESFAPAGGAGSVTLTTTSACTWTAVSNNPSFINITSGSSGSGNGTVNYSVGANTGPARMGTMTIAAQTFTVTQDSGCIFMLGSTNQNFVAAGGMNSVFVMTATGCTWNAVSNAGFITIDSGSSGSGNGTVNYSVSANTGPARMGAMTIAGITFTVTQDPGCAFTLDRDHQSFAGNGGNGTVNVTASDAACAWTASTASTFIHTTSGAASTGTGAVQYSVDANPGSTIRSDTITIAGHTFTVYQGINFLDVPSNDVFYTVVGQLSARGVTLGCGGGNYCPNDPVTREQMAAFILRAKGEFSPPTPASQRFNDVPPQNVFYNFIDRLAVLQITLGCTPDHLFYCPSDPVKREQMSAFILRGLGEFNPPTPGSQRFSDVPPANVFYNFIDRLAVLQITL